MRSGIRILQCHYQLSSLRRSYSHIASGMVKVQVRQGVVVGEERRTRNGIPFNCFQGIPYAMPPIGELRFKSPVPLERFDTPELDCSKERDVSHHRDPITQKIGGSEDCLHLNVFAPKTERGPLPVMVWIHGGAFYFGSSSSEYFYPLSLLEEDVLVVTLNYRLGALGFLSLPEEGVWGNAGLKDQRLALQWVQENIAHFNGDPGNVTLFGQSAGATAVHLHAYAKHANKLFHKAIMQSGSANMEWAFQANPVHKTFRMAELLGCTSRNTQEIMKFLRSANVTPLDILKNTIKVLTPDERRRGLPITFRPVIEDASSPDSFIDTPILERLSERGALTMPTIMGYNSAEGISMVVNAVNKLQLIEEDLARFVPRNIPLPPNHNEVQELARQMRDFYFRGQSLSPKVLNELTDLLSDYHFTVDMQLAAELHVRHQPEAPLYFYQFDYVGGRNMYKRILQMDRLRGACHGDELFYQFQMAGDDSSLETQDECMVKLLAQLWANFARHAVQSPKNEKDPFVLDCLMIAKQCEMRRNPDSERMEFWRKVYRTYPPNDYSRLSAKL